MYSDFRSSLISVTDFFSIQFTFLLKLSFAILSDHLFYGYLLTEKYSGKATRTYLCGKNVLVIIIAIIPV